MNYTVNIKTLPERTVASVRMTLPRYEDQGLLWETLARETAPLHLVPDDPCYCSATYYDEGFQETDVDAEAQKTVRGSYPDTEHVRFKTVPAVTYASTLFKGPYELIGEAIAAVAAWVEANGYAYAGPMFNLYHVHPGQTENPAEYVTEVCCPVEKN